FFGRVERRRDAVLLRQNHRVLIGTRGQTANAGPIVIVGGQPERRLLRRHPLHRKFDGTAHPRRGGDSSGGYHAIVFVIGHEGQKVGGLRQRDEVVSARPLTEVVEQYPGSAIVAGQPGNDRDRKVQTGGMEGGGAILD